MNEPIPVYRADPCCAECSATCCQRLSGEAGPEDMLRFGSTVEEGLIVVLSTGQWCIDWWEGDPRDGIPEEQQIDCGYYVRPRVLSDKLGIFNGSWGGICIFWCSEGCKLLFEQRPLGCRALKPDPNNPGIGCSFGGNWNKRLAAISWEPYWNFISRLDDGGDVQPVDRLAENET